MNLQEAIEIIKEAEWGLPATDKNEATQRWKLMDPTKALAIEALQKQMPQKPNTCNMTTICPECGRHWKRYYSFCPDCGQKIDWSK